MRTLPFSAKLIACDHLKGDGNGKHETLGKLVGQVQAVEVYVNLKKPSKDWYQSS
jgi:hypothetical protein